MYVVIGVLTATFVILWRLSTSNPAVDFITCIAGISTFFVAILTALNVYITSSQIEVANKQLEEMKYERSMREQPLLLLENLKFKIEKPRFFYTPPEDNYSFQSRYFVTTDIKNCSNYPCISVDATAELKVIHDKTPFRLSTVYKRISTIAPGATCSVDFLFSGDEITWLFDSLRERQTQNLPKINYEITYKNLNGGIFQLNGQAILVPTEDSLDIIRQWHGRINAAYIEEQESIAFLKAKKGTKEWDKTFEKIKQQFSSSITDCSDVGIECLEIPEECSVSTLTVEQYNEKRNNYQYAHYVHRAANCVKDGKK